ncbi:DUF1661 domain-containing protein [Porphyromonas gulae]|nr:DUF1661 domain-containing protein [Porphyromonas gulae]
MRRRKFSLQKDFSAGNVGGWSGIKGTPGERRVSKKTEVINRTSRKSSRKSPKSQTKIHQKWRENIFGPVRDFFNSRTKTKLFSDHVLQPQIHRIFQTKMEMTELSTKSEDIIIRGDRLTSEKRVF